MSRVIDEHRVYLADVHRLDAFRRAIRQLVTSESIVLDLASGTGILGFLACEAGARRVYGIESDGIVGLARRLARANGFADRYIGVRGVSTRVTLPEPVDLVVTDQMGPFGFEAGVFSMLVDAAHRFLKPGGHIVPRSIAIQIVPLSDDDVFRRVQFWRSRPAGLDYSAAASIAENTGYPTRLDDASTFLAQPKVLSEWAMPTDTADIGGAVEFTLTRGGRLDGIAGWFSATLGDGVVMTNAPGAPSRIDRRNVILPFSPAVEVNAGDRLTLTLHIQHREVMVTWKGELHRQDGTSHALVGSTFRGLLVSSEDLERTKPDARPRLTRVGEARRMILELADGHHMVAEIEARVASAFPELFATGDSVAAFVGEVLVPYAR